ncbi:hypothetical protein D3C73_636830 [compost metagenome]
MVRQRHLFIRHLRIIFVPSYVIFYRVAGSVQCSIDDIDDISIGLFRIIFIKQDRFGRTILKEYLQGFWIDCTIPKPSSERIINLDIGTQPNLNPGDIPVTV